MAIRRLSNGQWVTEFQAGGERIFRRLPKICGKADAQALEAKLRREIWERDQLGRKDEPSLAAVIQLWLNATEANRKDKRNPRQNAVHLAPFVKDKTVREVADASSEALAEWSTSLTPATINRRLAILRAATRWAWKQGLVTDNLAGRVPRLREENARQVYLTAAQIKKLAMAAPSETCRAAIMIAAYTGLRASELIGQRAVIGSKGSLMVATSKPGKPRVVPVGTPALPYLSALPLGLSYRRLIGQFWEARKAAGMEHVHFHDLRHSTASMLINAGVDLYTVGAILGHSSPMTTKRYAHLAQSTLNKAMRKLK